jgi:hypothetical protein
MSDDADFSEIRRNIAKWSADMDDRALDIMEYVGNKAETYAKKNHPWQNDTQAAEDGLKASSEKTSDGARAVLSHSVIYGPRLELDFGKRFAIILESITKNSSPQMMGKMLQGSFEGGAGRESIRVTAKHKKTTGK